MLGFAMGEHLLTCVHGGVVVLVSLTELPWRCYRPLRLCPCNTHVRAPSHFHVYTCQLKSSAPMELRQRRICSWTPAEVAGRASS